MAWSDLWGQMRRGAGAGLGQIGSYLNLPEMGISERIAGTVAPRVAGTQSNNMYTPWPPDTGSYQNQYSPTWAAQQSGGTQAPDYNVPTGADLAAWNASYSQVMGDYDTQLRALEAQKLGIMNQAKSFRKAHQRVANQRS